MLMAMSLDQRYEEMISRVTRKLVDKIGPDRLEEIYASDKDPIGEAMPKVIEEAGDALAESLKRRIPEMVGDRRANFARYNAIIEEYWGEAFGFLEALVRIAFESGEDFFSSHAPTAKSEEDLVFYVLTRLHVRACRIGEEALVLMKNGYGLAAQARWRSLHEVVVVAAFIEKHGNDVAERYLLHEGIESWRAIEEYQARVGRLAGYEPATEGEFAEARKIRDDLVARFGPSFEGAYGWAAEVLARHPSRKARGFIAIEEDVELDHHRSHYRMASHATHANPKGILFMPDLHAEEDGLLAGPSYHGLADPGHAVCLSLTSITATVLGSRDGVAMPFIVSAMLRLCDEAEIAFSEAQDSVDQAGPRLGESDS
jgi:Family of unknown function (DUF5677)